MSKLVWDASGERYYETGVKNVVLYPKTGSNGAYSEGVAWNGVIGISENPSGGEANPIYADNIKYLNLMSNEEFGFSIEAYTYPDEFEQCDGSAPFAQGAIITQQARKEFGLCYRTEVGNDADGLNAYKLHIVYGCLASPSGKDHNTINESPEAITFSWEVTTTPIEVAGFSKPTAHLVIDSRTADATKLAQLEALLYGSGGQSAANAQLPDPATIATTLGAVVAG